MREAMREAVQGIQVSAQPPVPAEHPTTQRERLLAAA
jgi:hypothetical protein